MKLIPQHKELPWLWNTPGKSQMQKFRRKDKHGRKKNAEEAVKEWLAEKGYDYEVRTYMPGENGENQVRKEKNTISIPAGVKDVEAFMGQFVQSFESIDGITELNGKL